MIYIVYEIYSLADIRVDRLKWNILYVIKSSTWKNCKREIIKYRENKIEFRLFVIDLIGE